MCFPTEFKCDQIHHCSDFTDESVAECPQCVGNSSMFTCKRHEKMTCWPKKDIIKKHRYQCDGNYLHCDDGSDELPEVCNDCTEPGFTMCRDGSRCFNKTEHICDAHHNAGGSVLCSDGSDETISNMNNSSQKSCSYCSEEGYVPCPGFPYNCGRVCDGYQTCPDGWDELLSSCNSGHQAIRAGQGKARGLGLDKIITSNCSGPNIFPCKDGSKCIRKALLCNNLKDCKDGSDEDSAACKDRCKSLYENGTSLLPCDNGSCIWLENACSARNQSLCKDGEDMKPSLCQDKCYTHFPGIVDPYRWPCNDAKKCILYTSRCDQVPDCDDGTHAKKSSDERGCHPVTQIRLPQTVMFSLVMVVMSWFLFFAFFLCSRSIEDMPVVQTESDPNPEQPNPSFLLHPALSDMDNPSWTWEEVGEQLRLEVVFFNRDPQVLFSFLLHIEAQDAHPDNVHNAFKGFYGYLSSKGYDSIAVAASIRETIGHHRLAHMALRGPPSFIDRKAFQIGKWLRELETKGKAHQCFVTTLRAFQVSAFPFAFHFDYAKDLIIYLILRETVRAVEGNCELIGLDCFFTSGTEKDLLMAILLTFCISTLLTSINSYLERKIFFKTNFWLNLAFGIMSPFLPAVFHIRLSHKKHKIKRQKSSLSRDALRLKTDKIETMANSLQQTREIEVGLESVMQILLPLGLACFYPYVFTAPSGQKYSYFFGVALIVLKGHHILVLASIFRSFLTPCMFYVNQTDVLRHGSLNISRKLVLMARNVLFLLVRVFVITSAIFIPVISQWKPDQFVDASFLLDDHRIHTEFQRYFRRSLDVLTTDIRWNAQIFGLFLLLHLLLVAIIAIFSSPKFGKSTMRERMMYLISSFWLPLPFLTIRGVDRGKEKTELCLIVALHSAENFLIVLASRLVYLQESYPARFVTFDCVLVILNTLAVLLSVFYVSKMELYAGLPQNPSSHPTFGPEVSSHLH